MRLSHGFTWFKIVCLVLAILLIFTIRWGAIVAPQVRATADKVVSLNNLQKVDVHGKVGGCIRLDLNGTV